MNNKCVSRKIAFFFAALMLSSTLTVFSTSSVNAQTATGATEYPWPMIFGNYMRTGFQNGPGPSTAHLLWKAGDGSQPMGGLPAWGTAVADGKVFQGCYDTGDVYAWDENTGELIWHQHLNHTAYGVMYYNGKIYCAGMSYEPHTVAAVTGDEWVCLDATNGNIKWVWKIPPVINGIPQNNTIYAGNWLYVNPSQPTVYKDKLWVKITAGYALLNPDTGAVLSYLTNGESCSFPSFDGDYHYGMMGNGSAYCINVDTLQYKWVTPRLRLGGNHITISGGFLYVSNYDGNITRLSEADGRLFWEFPWTARTQELPASAIMSYGPPPSVAYSRVLFGGVEGAIYSVDCAVDNTAQWKFQTGGAIYAQSAVADGKFYTGSSDGHVYCLTTTGELVWKYDTGYQISGSPAIADGKLFVVGDNRYMYCFGPGPASALTLDTPTVLTVGQNLPITGKFTDSSGEGIADVTVALKYRLEPMLQPKDIATVTTSSDGSFSYTWTPSFDGYYDITASYEEPEIAGYSSSNKTVSVRVAPASQQGTGTQSNVDLAPVTNAINSLQTYLVIIAALVVIAIAVSIIAVAYSRKKIA